jgi:regulator of protease activity HflC (stomatin/prohibitin superfamily)
MSNFDPVNEAIQNAIQRQRFAPSRPQQAEAKVSNSVGCLFFLLLSAVGGFVLFREAENLLDPLRLAGMVGWMIVSGVIASMIRIAAQWERAVVFRLGRFSSVKGPGLFAVIPLIDQVQTVDTRVITLDIPRQEAITKDNVPVSIDGVIFMQVERPDQAIINVQSYMLAIQQYARTALRDVIGGRQLDEVLTERESIGHEIEQLVIRECEHWGLEVAGIRIQDIILPEDLKRVMSRQAAAEREKRANITKSEGDRLAAENLAAAAATMAKSPGAMQLRSLQTIDGLGPTASNTVVLAIPIEVMEAVDAIAKIRRGEKQPEPPA